MPRRDPTAQMANTSEADFGKLSSRLSLLVGQALNDISERVDEALLMDGANTQVLHEFREDFSQLYTKIMDRINPETFVRSNYIAANEFLNTWTGYVKDQDKLDRICLVFNFDSLELPQDIVDLSKVNPETAEARAAFEDGVDANGQHPTDPTVPQKGKKRSRTIVSGLPPGDRGVTLPLKIPSAEWEKVKSKAAVEGKTGAAYVREKIPLKTVIKLLLG